ncbi:TPA: ead/Ea22-like family protein [Citrobacter amalonaticus]|nr:ead/Ea22-like family protein [Citrobacter amalonaticus]
MTNIDKQALRQLAGKATKGEWVVFAKPTPTYFDAIHSLAALLNGTVGDQKTLYMIDANGLCPALTGTGPNSANNAEFIAAANPATVLALLGELEKLQQANASQDDHINQQEDRIKSLEKKNGDLGKALGELETRGFSSAVSDVLAERRRQVTVEGWTPEHDDKYMHCEIAVAAACYIMADDDPRAGVPELWPWPAGWWKPTNLRRDLVKAGALVLAEIERIDRAAGSKGE